MLRHHESVEMSITEMCLANQELGIGHPNGKAVRPTLAFMDQYQITACFAVRLDTRYQIQISKLRTAGRPTAIPDTIE